MAATRDPQEVGRHDEETMRRFCAARRQGDDGGMRHLWDELLTANYDRVRNLVALEGRSCSLSRDEREEAVQHALIRIATRLIHTFRGSSVGEWVLAVRTLVRFACRDVQRGAARISRWERPLETPGRGDRDPPHPDAEVYAVIEHRRHEQESAEEDADLRCEGQAFLDWAVPRLAPKRRAVIELDRRGATVEEIQRELGVSRDVVYASRSRALKDLAKLRDEYRP